jgi:hypothetical protein
LFETPTQTSERRKSSHFPTRTHASPHFMPHSQNITRPFFGEQPFLSLLFLRTLSKLLPFYFPPTCAHTCTDIERKYFVFVIGNGIYCPSFYAFFLSLYIRILLIGLKWRNKKEFAFGIKIDDDGFFCAWISRVKFL